MTQKRRLASINEIKNQLKLEIDKCSKTLKKYQKYIMGSMPHP